MSRSIRVAHVTTVDLSLRYLLLNQLEAIRAQGYEVYGLSAPGATVGALERGGVRFLPIPFVRATSLKPFQDLRAFAELVRVFRRERFTIVHTHTAKPDLYATWAARLAGVPIVITTLHGFLAHDLMPPFWRRSYLTLAKIGMAAADSVLSQNEEDVATAVRERICPGDKIRYLGNGIDTARFDRARIDAAGLERKRAELGIGTSETVVGFVGRLVAEKGVNELLGAAKLVRQQNANVRFLFVGPLDADKKDALTPEIAREYGIAEACVFTGSRGDMPEMYALMDVFVLPSHREGFPRSPMEASAMGVPCIVTDIRGCREAVAQDVNGVRVSLGKVDELAGAMLELVTNKEKARRLGENGVRMARERFDERRIFEMVSEEYARLIARYVQTDDAIPSHGKESRQLS